MNIWQFILVALPLIQFGGSMCKEFILPNPEKKEKRMGRFLGTIIWTVAIYYVLFRAGVLVLEE